MQCSTRHLFTALCCVLRAYSSSSIAGSSPSDAGKYNSVYATSIFTCLGISGLTELPASAVNDNFCDCKDGSDEPGTAACAGVTGARFYCRNSPSIGKFIYSSRVLDGICDCCDGSDEIGTQGQSRLCPNTCVAEAAALEGERERRRQTVIEGLKSFEQSQDNATTEVAAWRAQREAVGSEVEELTQQQEKAKAHVQEIEQELAQQVTAVGESTANSTQASAGSQIFFEDFERVDSMSTWKQAEGGSAHVIEDPKGQRGKVLALKDCTWGGDGFSVQGFNCNPAQRCKISFWARGAPWQGFSTSVKRTEHELVDAHSWLAVPTAGQGFEDRLLSTRSTDDWVHYEYVFPSQDMFQMFGSNDVRFTTSTIHIMVQAHGSTGFCSQTMFDDFQVRKEPSVKFADSDGDLMEFKLNDKEELDVYSNGNLVTANVQDLKLDGNLISFSTWKVKLTEGTKDLGQAVLSLSKQQAQTSKDSSPSTEPAKNNQLHHKKAKQVTQVSEYARWALDQKGEDESHEGEGLITDRSETTQDLELTKTSETQEAETQIAETLTPNNSSEATTQDLLEKAKASLKEIEKKLRTLKGRRFSLDNKLKQIAHGTRWFAMIDACVSKLIQQYKYKICYFGTAKQDSISLGSFEGWDSITGSFSSSPVMKFTHGQRCHDGPARSLSVQLTCGAVEELLDISEPSRCSYEAHIVHPAACQQEHLQELVAMSERKPLMPHEEL